MGEAFMFLIANDTSNCFGGYYLVRLKKFDFGRLINKEVYTCSDCTNDSLLDEWGLTPTAKGESELVEIERGLRVSTETIQQIATWADKKLEQKRIGWMNVFTDLETVGLPADLWAA